MKTPNVDMDCLGICFGPFHVGASGLCECVNNPVCLQMASYAPVPPADTSLRQYSWQTQAGIRPVESFLSNWSSSASTSSSSRATSNITFVSTIPPGFASDAPLWPVTLPFPFRFSTALTASIYISSKGAIMGGQPPPSCAAQAFSGLFAASSSANATAAAASSSSVCTSSYLPNLFAASLADYLDVSVANTTNITLWTSSPSAAVRVLYEGMILRGTAGGVHSFDVWLVDQSDAIVVRYLNVSDPAAGGPNATWLVGFKQSDMSSDTLPKDQTALDSERGWGLTGTIPSPSGAYPPRSAVQSNTSMTFCPIGVEYCASPRSGLPEGNTSVLITGVSLGLDANGVGCGLDIVWTCDFGSIIVPARLNPSRHTLECRSPAGTVNSAIVLNVRANGRIANSRRLFFTYSVNSTYPMTNSSSMDNNNTNMTTIVSAEERLCIDCAAFTTSSSCWKDCNGRWLGSATVDDCGVCAGGDTGLAYNGKRDCNGVCFGPFVRTVSNQCACISSSPSSSPSSSAVDVCAAYIKTNASTTTVVPATATNFFLRAAANTTANTSSSFPVRTDEVLVDMTQSQPQLVLLPFAFKMGDVTIRQVWLSRQGAVLLTPLPASSSSSPSSSSSSSSANMTCADTVQALNNPARLNSSTCRLNLIAGVMTSYDWSAYTYTPFSEAAGGGASAASVVAAAATEAASTSTTTSSSSSSARLLRINRPFGEADKEEEEEEEARGQQEVQLQEQPQRRSQPVSNKISPSSAIPPLLPPPLVIPSSAPSVTVWSSSDQWSVSYRNLRLQLTNTTSIATVPSWVSSLRISFRISLKKSDGSITVEVANLTDISTFAGLPWFTGLKSELLGQTPSDPSSSLDQQRAWLPNSIRYDTASPAKASLLYGAAMTSQVCPLPASYCVRPVSGPASGGTVVQFINAAILLQSSSAAAAAAAAASMMGCAATYSWTCNFGGVIVPATFVSTSSSIECLSPAGADNSTVLLTLLADGQPVMRSARFFSYNASTRSSSSSSTNQTQICIECASFLARQQCWQDCSGRWFGSAKLDDCGVCSGGATGRLPNANKDCQGICFGPFYQPRTSPKTLDDRLAEGQCLCDTSKSLCRFYNKTSGPESVTTTLSSVTYYRIAVLFTFSLVSVGILLMRMSFIRGCVGRSE